MNTYIIKIITAECFRKHEVFALAMLDDKTMPSSTLWTLSAYGPEDFFDFKLRLAQKLHYSPNQFRLWVLEERDNQLLRSVISADKNCNAVSEITIIDYTNLWAKKTQRMIFVKQFDASKHKLTRIGHFHVDHRLRDLSHLVKAHTNFPQNKHLEFYEVKSKLE
ncbi:hypothetical protein VP01_7501g1 [Puccinia sorghi]|uniref:Ubiquitin carboxyl-terminal hydrolase 7 ICP0-binding domain-containing protein n=1 Tax=Puccinia sorghi TaxID=27349 RepID=A0A0L6UC93_9BASI|nr:hypothetical protein VP01_7501g1 [Puccinia sorghi]